MNKLLLKSLIFLLQIFWFANGVAQNNFYKQEREKLAHRQTDESEWAKERKKVQKYFIQNEFAKAEEYLDKVFQKKGKDVYLLMADGYFLKGEEAEKNKEWEKSIGFFEKALNFYKKSDYPTSDFVFRDLGIAHINLFKKDHHHLDLVKEAYNEFQKSKSDDLINFYDAEFVWLYFDDYKEKGGEGVLNKAYQSCKNNNQIALADYKAICTEVADALFSAYTQHPQQKESLEKALTLYKKTKNKEQLNRSYRLLADYYINYTEDPEKAMEYVKKVEGLTDSEKEVYNKRINAKLIELCRTADDCIKLYKRKYDLKDDIFIKAIEVTSSIEDCDKLYTEFPEYKSEIKAKALSLIHNVDDCETALYYFPSKKLEIGEKAIELAETFGELGFVYEHFPHFDSIAEKKALFNVENIQDKRAFTTYFPQSIYTPDIQKEILLEEKINRKLLVIKEEINNLLVGAYSEGKLTDKKASSIRFIETRTDPDRVEIPYTFKWVVHYATRPMEYDLAFTAVLHLKDYAVDLQDVKLLMDDDVQDLDKFNALKEKIVIKIKPIIYDLTQLKLLEAKREVKEPLPSFYNFKKEEDTVLMEPSLMQDAIDSGENIQEDDLFTIAEKMPQFPGGKDALKKYITERLRYPMRAKIAGVQGEVIVSFVVEKDGSVSSVRVRKGLDEECDEAAKKVVKGMPRWIPGEINGKPVRVLYSLPINFKLSD